MIIFTVNGVDLTPYMKFGGLKFKRNDIDGPNAGRGLTGDLIRDRVATKLRWDFTTHLMSMSDANTLLSLLMPEWLTLQTNYNEDGALRTYTVYTNNIETPFLMYRNINGNLQEWVGEFSVPIIEK